MDQAGGRLSPEGCGSNSPTALAPDFLDPGCPIRGQSNTSSSIFDTNSDVLRLQNTDGNINNSRSMLPWGAQKENPPHPYTAHMHIDLDIKPGEFAMRTLFADFTLQAERKIEAVMTAPQERLLSKELQVGEDAAFDQLLSALGQVAEHCLPSLLRALFAWYDRQMIDCSAPAQTQPTPRTTGGKPAPSSSTDPKSKSTDQVDRSEVDIANERRDLAVEFIFCLVLIQVLRQLPFHPGHEDLVGSIENLAFKHFKYREGTQNSANAANIHIVADLYAEVVGVLAQARFLSVRKRFMAELKELRSREPTPLSSQSIIALLMGMKFFRVKMVPIEDFEASFQFMHECAQYFLEVKDKDIKHALAGLFVEILVPVAAAVKNEVNVPCLKNFVELLYPQTLDLCMKNKHRLALFPLVTCLLCVSQKSFFLHSWHCFLALCLQHLKNRDPKMCRVALESLYRLLWVYMIRVKCESNTATHSRLQSIVNSLFPKGSKGVVPRDTPLNIFVKIIQFIAQERLDFAMREIVFDLLSVGRPIKIILTPERMSIGLRAFLVVADSLQQKEGEPPMPRSVGVLPSGNTLRVKKTYLNKMLTEDTARSIGMSAYFPHVRLVFVHILRALDTQYGRPLMMTNTQNVNKEPDEMITGERKPRIDLFRTCVAAVPRLVPDGMTGAELVDLLSRLTVHMDEELRALAYQSLQTLVLDFPAWRHDVLSGFVYFLSRDVHDTFPQLLDNGLRMLLQLLSSWRHAGGGAGTVITTTTTATTMNLPPPTSTVSSATSSSNSSTLGPASVITGANISTGAAAVTNVPDTIWGVLHQLEGFALVMLCHARPCPRRLAVHILKEVKHLLRTVPVIEVDQPVIDVIDACCLQTVIDKCMPMLPVSERTAILATPSVDLQWISERNSPVWTTAGYNHHANSNTSATNITDDSQKQGSNSQHQQRNVDPWSVCLLELVQRGRIVTRCPQAAAFAWPFAYTRTHSLFAVVDPTPVSDNRASLLRGGVGAAVRGRSGTGGSGSSSAGGSAGGGAASGAADADDHLATWRNYATLGFRLIPSIAVVGSSGVLPRCASPDLSLREELMMLSSSLTSTFSSSMSMSSSSPDSVATEKIDGPASASPSTFYKLIVPLLRCETNDLRDAAVHAIGHCNSDALKDLMDELLVYIREAVDRKQENMRRRKRRDGLRVQLTRVFDIIAEQGTFGVSGCCVLDRETHALHTSFVEFVEGTRLFLEADKDIQALTEIKLHFSNFIRKMIESLPLETRKTLLKRELRSQLFTLFSSWTGRYSAVAAAAATEEKQHQHQHLHQHQQQHLHQQLLDEYASGVNAAVDINELLLAALQAMAAILCCGPTFNPAALAEEGALYPWLYLLLASKHNKVHKLGFETMVLLLENNPDIGPLLDWVVDRCFTAEAKIADACFLALATVFSIREYPCDHYTAIINVTLLNTGCPRTNVHETALQLLQTLDKRFFAPLRPLPPVTASDAVASATAGETLDLLLSTSYCRSQMYLSKQLAELHPELTMPMFSEITYRVQSARASVRRLLLQYLLPWLHNMELVDPNVPNANPLSYYQYCGLGIGRRDGWGSAEATEMVLNNLFYITIKFSDEHPKAVEDCWSTLCACWPNNLKVIIRYLIIISGMAPNELLSYTKRVVVYLARARPDRLLDEMMTELQTVETLNCVIERTETPPFYRLTSMRKASSHSDQTHAAGGQTSNESNGYNGNRGNELGIEKGTIHTKRHSGEDPGKMLNQPQQHHRIRGGSGPSRLGYEVIGGASTPSPSVEGTTTNVGSLSLPTEGAGEANARQPHPLPMPEYGGFFAPLTEYLPDASQPVSGFHRCNVAVMLLTDVVVDAGGGVGGEMSSWSVHVPLMLHIVLLGMDHSRPLVHQHCNALLLNMLLVLVDHNDHLAVSHIFLTARAAHLSLGLHVPDLPVIKHNFTEPDAVFDSYLSGISIVPTVTPTVATVANDDTAGSLQLPSSGQSSLSSNEMMTNSIASTASTIFDGAPPLASTESSSSNTIIASASASAPASVPPELPRPGPNMPLPHVVKSLISFLALRRNQCLWAYEDITAKVWSVKSAEQLEVLLQHVVRIFRSCSPGLEERWSQTALQLGLSSSSRHLAGRSLQIFRALRVPITARMLSDILSRLVETVSEQGEDMQGYVTELLLTLEAVVDALDSDFRPIDVIKEIFKSTPNLMNNGSSTGSKDPQQVALSSVNTQAQPGAGKRSPLTPKLGGRETCIQHGRSTSYSVSSYHCMRRHVTRVANTNVAPTEEPLLSSSSSSSSSPKDNTGGIRGRAATEVDHSHAHRAGRYATNTSSSSSTNLSRSRSAQSLKLLGDATIQDDKMTILAQLFWVAVSLLESDYEHEFLLALRLLSRVLHRLPLERPDARDKVEKLQQQLRWTNFHGVHALLLKGCTSAATYDAVVPLLSQLTLLLELPVVDPTQTLAFPMNVIALLPYMLVNFEDANELCVRSAENIAQASADRGKKLSNLGTVMTLYSRRNFSKESFQWTKCVVKYLYDTYAHLSLNILSFLVEVLEKGPSSLQPAVLSIIHCLMHYMELSPGLNTELLRVIARHMGGQHWREALKIIKLVVARSSSLVAPPPSQQQQQWSSTTSAHSYEQQTPSPSIHPSFNDNEIFAKKELPGRTMEFSFDVSQTPVIARKFAQGQQQQQWVEASPRRSASLSPADAAGQLAGWKRPWSCQSRVRECLVAVLTTCGQRVGLPKSPSVIFSQSSDLMERQSSMASSTEEVSGPDVSGGSRRDDANTHDQFGVFKDFDFLEYESESVEGESADNFNWGVRRRPLLEDDMQDREGVGSACAVEESVSEDTPVLGKKYQMVSPIPKRDESSDEEVGSESPLDEVVASMQPPEFPASVPTSVPASTASAAPAVAPPVSLRLRTKRLRSATSPARSDTSGSSGGDLGDVTPCNASPNLSALMINFRPILRDDAEECWRRNVLAMLDLPSTASSLDLFQIVCRMVKLVAEKCVAVTRDACNALQWSSGLGSGQFTTDRLLATCELLGGNDACVSPYTWFSIDATQDARLRNAARFDLLDLQEHLETFLDRNDHVAECLNGMRTSLKLHLLSVDEEPGSSLSTTTTTSTTTTSQPGPLDELSLELVRALYKMQFQCVLLIEAEHKMLARLFAHARASRAGSLPDLSAQVSAIRADVLRAHMSASASASASPGPIPTNRDDDATLIDLVRHSDWPAALQHVRRMRLLLAHHDDRDDENENYHCVEHHHDDDNDTITVLNAYSRLIAHDLPGAIVVTTNEKDLLELTSKLRESLYLVLNAMNQVEHESVSRRKTEC